jgi:hypothetical protein
VDSVSHHKRNIRNTRLIKLNNEELHKLHSSPGTFRMIKSRRMRWVGHEARIGKKMNACMILEGKVDQDVGGWTKLKLRDTTRCYGLD